MKALRNFLFSIAVTIVMILAVILFAYSLSRLIHKGDDRVRTISYHHH